MTRKIRLRTNVFVIGAAGNSLGISFAREQRAATFPVIENRSVLLVPRTRGERRMAQNGVNGPDEVS